MKVALKELRETEVWLKIIVLAKLIQPLTKLSPLLKESDELISILFKSIDTAKKKMSDSDKNTPVSVTLQSSLRYAQTGRRDRSVSVSLHLDKSVFSAWRICLDKTP